ncbi:PIG-L family deacetylase [uncultured Microbacterium sp.]|uniref:PIG-L family deacetylase n=1 Tax=uncultured Microbacterium sp. TaxID=191216 RepID=UPI0028D41AFE|nr:PIG-L family deacetylase [uncultured Microbacterium sp.]
MLLAVVGCAPDGRAGAVPTTSTSAAATATPTPTPTPTEAPPPARNNLTGEQILSMAAACGGLTAADPAAPGVPLRDVSQWAADALMFYASTADCAEIPVVVARDASHVDPDGTVFASPLQLLEPICEAGTVVSFWAHYDDDLIFANPALQDAFDEGKCLRTFFFTESDAGEGNSSYAENREVGIRAAYDRVRGQSGPWVDRSVLLRDGVTVTLTRPENDGRISLLMLRLPDGGVSGGGYRGTGSESLPKLISGDLPALHTLDTEQAVTLEQLQNTVAEVVAGYHATQVLGPLPGFATGSSGDHPDHRAVGRILAAPVDAGLVDPAIVMYAMGYPSAKMAANLSGGVLARKSGTFALYASHDPVISCREAAACLKVNRFGDWLQRQYLYPHAELERNE